jgi:hypothetical protein
MTQHLEYSSGNTKITGGATMIINMGSATRCPSASLGLCEIAGKCYAVNAEHFRPQVLPYRDRQQEYWLGHDAESIALDILAVQARKHQPFRYCRFNESGDFHTAECCHKLSDIARITHATGDPLVYYTYTHRTDLLPHLADRPRNLVIQVSTSDPGAAKDYTAMGFNVFFCDTAISVKGRHVVSGMPAHDWATQELRKKYGASALLCGWDCGVCGYCKTNHHKPIYICLH